MNGLHRQAGRRRRGVAVVYVACLLCLVAASGIAWRAWRRAHRGVEAVRRDATEVQLGVNVDLGQVDAEELDRALRDVAALGFRWVRQRFPWSAIEPQPGVYRWERWDALVDGVERHGLGMIAVLDGPPEWSVRGDPVPLPCVPPWREDAYARFVSAFARRYGEVIDHYQVWDEPNLSRSWGGGHAAPCAYSVLLQAAYPAIHAADPTAWVLGGGLAPTQAPGPDNLNDLTYLRQLYASGGGPYFDILAIKSYGFWSGPDDRRVEPDVLNYSRAVATRELMRARGDSAKPVWAVEWGWNVLPAEWPGERPPWGRDVLAVQRPRILGAVARALAEWPWLKAMCWAEYQPDVPASDPRWGFALRDIDGSPTPLYDVLRATQDTQRVLSYWPRPWTMRWVGASLLLLVAGVGWVIGWRRCAETCGDVLRGLWEQWIALPPSYPLLALLGTAVLYALTPWPEWVLIELGIAALLLYPHPRWALLGAVFAIPFFYGAKPVGTLRLVPSETLLLLALVVHGVRWSREKGWRLVLSGWSALDGVWVLWVAWGALSPANAPDPPLAWREWRLCLLGPALLYFLLRAGRGRAQTSPDQGQPSVSTPMSEPLLAWMLSGVVVALVGMGQWLAGALLPSGAGLVPAGSVGRVTGVYYSPNHVALYLGRILPLALTLALWGGLERRWRSWMWGAAALLGVVLYLTYSRGAWLLAVPVALAVMGWSYRRRFRWSMAAGAVLVLACLIGGVFYGRGEALSDLLDEVRLPVWQSTIEMIADHPWRGVGLDGFRFVYPHYMRTEAWGEPLLYHPHNLWLDAAVRLGLPGLGAFVALVVYSVREIARSRGVRSPLQRAVAVGLLAGFLAALAHGLVDSGYFLPDLAWSLALVTGAGQAYAHVSGVGA